MKLHFSTQTAVNHRYRKIKAVINALKIQLQEVPHETTTDLTTVSPFNALPLLQTPQGTFFSSNTIVRYLANSQNQLYGQNIHNQSLIDQWLDVVASDFEAAVSALVVARDGKEVETQLVADDIHKFLKVVEAHLTGKKFLVGDELSIADLSIAPALNVVLTTLLGEEERKTYPNIVAWYLSLVATDATIGSKDLPKEAHKAFKAKPKKQNKKEEKKQETKEEKKPQPKVDEDDLFGDDEPSNEASKPKPKPQVVKPKKEKPAAKSMIVFDVKVYEMETDLLALFEKIKMQIVIDGLVWNNEPKILPIAFGMNKLQVACIVEDSKVSIDDIYEKIESWEDEVQSIDTVSFQKL